MESNSNDNYVLVLEDRTEVKNEKEAGKLSVVSGIDDKGNLKTTEAIAANQAAFLKFNNKDGLLKNFMANFLKQFNNPTHYGLYKVLADNVEQGVDNLRTMLQSREKPESKQQLAEMGVPFEDYLPRQKNATAIDPKKVDWKMLDNLGLSRERLEQSGELEKMLNWQKSNLITIAVPIGGTIIYTEARFAFRTDDNGNIGLAIHPLRKKPQLDFPYMGYKFSPEEKEQLLAMGNLGKTIEVTPKNGEPFSAYVSIDPQTNEIIALRADRVNIPKEIKGVTLSDAQYKELVEGKAVKVEGMTAKTLSERFGKVLQQRQSMTINRNDKSTSISTQMDSLIPASKISNLTQGIFVGAVSDNFDERIEQKIFHAEIVVDSAKVSKEMKANQPIPTIADFTNEDGSDNLKETIEVNYKCIKQDIFALVDNEFARIKADPILKHLIKNDK